jgi:hypothetical protein
VEGTIQPTTGVERNGKAKAALTKLASIERSKVGDAPSAPKAKQTVPSAEQENLGPGWNHVRVGHVVKAATLPPPEPSPGPVTESPTRDEVTPTRTKGKTMKSAQSHVMP